MDNSVASIILIVLYILVSIGSLFLAIVFAFRRPFKTWADFLITTFMLGICTRIGIDVLFFLNFELSNLILYIGAVATIIAGICLLFFVRLQKPDWNFRKYDILHLVVIVLGIPPIFFSGLQPMFYFYVFATCHNVVYILLSWYEFGKLPKPFVERGLMLKLLITATLLFSILLITMLPIMVYLGMALVILAYVAISWMNYCLMDFSKANSPKNNVKSIPEQRSKEVEQRIRHGLEEEKVFTDPKLSLSKLARAIQVPSYVISNVINQEFKCSFNELVNHYRVEEIKMELLKNSNSEFTIEGIAKSNGFHSTSAFYQAFKRETGVTPNTFIQNSKLLEHTS